MADFRLLSRKSRALGASSSLGCWSDEGLYTLNLVHGCPYECAYCRHRAASHLKGEYYEIYPTLHLQLLEELATLRKRRHPIRAILMNTESDAFFGDPRVDEAATCCLEVLSLHGIPILVQTRGILPPSAMDILERAPPGSAVIFNIPTLSPEFQHAFEPRNPSLVERRRMMHELVQRGIPLRGRVDPLLPQENDSDDSVHSVLAEFARADVVHVAISYLIWSEPVGHRLKQRLPPSRFALLQQWFRDQDGIVRPLLGREYRLSRYRRFVEFARSIGVQLHVCACKNADLSRTTCFGALPAPLVPPHSPSPRRIV